MEDTCFYCGSRTQDLPATAVNKGRVYCGQVCLRAWTKRYGVDLHNTPSEADEAILVKPGGGRPVEKLGGIPL